MNLPQSEDEQKIRKLISEWLDATVAGDVDKITPLMTEDVVFLVAGHPPIRGRDTFAASQREIFQHVRIEPECDIQEVRVSGTLAYCWNYLTVNILPLNGGATMRRKGFTLTVLKKSGAGEWQVYRDGNLLSDEL